MRSFSLGILILFILCLSCPAGTITDPFNDSQVGCVKSLTTPFTNCDVIGNEGFFDIEKATVSITSSLIKVSLYFNYGGGLSLSPFSVGGATFNAGDVVFYDPANPRTPHYDSLLTYPEYLYGVPL